MGSLALVLAMAAGAADWLASPAAAEFRERVVQLALIYGESSGIDPQGFKVATRAKAPPKDGCADVEVVTTKGEQTLRRETVHACRTH